MELIRFGCELRFASPVPMLEAHETVFKRFMGRRPDTENWLQPGLSLENREARELLGVERNRAFAAIEGPSSIDHAVDTMRQRIALVADGFTFPEVSRWGARSLWVQGQESSASGLIDLFKRHALVGFQPAQEASDVALTLDFEGPLDDSTVTVTCGPTWPSEMQERFLTFPAEGLPDQFILADVDLGATSPGEYNQRALGRFLTSAAKVGEDYALRLAQAIAGDDK